MADINEQFMSILGRAPTSAEAEYFNKFLGEGSIQAHEVGQILQATPEFQQTKLQQDTTKFGEQLNAQNGVLLDQAGAQAQSRFAGLGRANSSALGASVMQAGGQLAQARQSALADFYGKGLQQNAALYQNGGQSALERGYGLRDETRQFGQQMQLAKYNQDNYNNYLDQANRKAKSQGMASLGGAIIGGGIGAFAGGPGGAMIGSQVGSKAGGLF